MKKFSCLVCFIFLQSCLVNHAFVPTGYEPSLLQEKKDSHLNLSLSPFNLLKFNYNRALSDKMGLGISSVHCFKLFSIDCGAFYYLNSKKLNIDLGGGLHYFKNNSKMNDVPNTIVGLIGAANGYYTQDFNISTYAPFFASSLIYKTKGKIDFGLSFKASYNFIDSYTYYQRIGTYQGRANATPLDNESVIERPSPFFSLEPALNLYFAKKPYTLFRLQLGYNYRNATMTHYYSFTQTMRFNPVVNTSMEHPTINPITLNICLIICLSNPRNEAKKN